ncbi:MAG: SDR family NAD(P)-dependent oxidoreductase [Deinococcales bacterium]
MLTQKIFLVTGASGAIAGYITDSLQGAGAQVIRLDRNAKPNTDLVVDLSDLTQCRAGIEQVLKKYGRLDGIVHTVGGFAMQSAQAYTPELLPQMLEVNLHSTVHLAIASLEALQASGGFFGSIAAGQVARGGAAKTAAYTASKGAMALYLQCLALEIKAVQFGIVYPMGTVDTPANRQAMPGANTETWVSPQEIGEAFVFMASRSSRGRVQEVRIFGG